jgi:hypothetical protein
MKNMLDFGINGGIIEIEISAEKLYYTIIGQEHEMKALLQNINKSTGSLYFISKLTLPLAIVAEKESKLLKINIELGSSIEQVQCSILCECKNREERQLYTLLCIVHDIEADRYILKFPEIELKENIEPEKTILNDMQKFLKVTPKILKDTLRLVDITGADDDILVYCARTSKQVYINKKKQKTEEEK